LNNESDLAPLRMAIKNIAVGKNGAKPMPEEITPAVEAVLQRIDVEMAAGGVVQEALILKAAMLGSLFMKVEIHEHERPLLARCAGAGKQATTQGRTRGTNTCSAADVIAAAAPSVAPGSRLHETIVKLLGYEYLSGEETEELFDVLFASDACKLAQALVLPVMRVRHESSQELAAMARSLMKTALPQFSQASSPLPKGPPVAHLAEPFDGISRSVMVTPLLAAHLQTKWGMRVVTHMGSSSGPKYGPNTKDLVNVLGPSDAPRLNSNAELTGTPTFGYYADQESISPVMRDWQALRRVVMKRPGLATAEKFLDTVGCSLFVSSAFHPPYTEKMADMAEELGFPAAIVLRRGLEGSLAFPVSGKRTADVLCSVRLADGSYERHNFVFGVLDIGETHEADELDAERLQEVDQLTPEGIARLVKAYHNNNGSSGDETFDKRVRVTLAGIDKAIEWIISKADGI